jgi:hypothetical protein
MTRKHFQALAHTVKTELVFLPDKDRRKVAMELARFCRQFNSNFDDSKFIEKCEV